MEKRINLNQLEPEAYKAILGLEKYLADTKLNPTHKHLIKIRASQLNGCAYCINMHTRDARKAGETEQRIYLLNAWRETSLYTDEERAILALTEDVTLISNCVPGESYTNAAKIFDEHYLAQILMVIVAINAWNRVGVTTQMELD